MKDAQPKKVTELRNLGDNRTIVLYTNDNQVHRKVRDQASPIKTVPYEKEQRGKTVMVGVDVYFRKGHRKWLEENLGVRTEKTGRGYGEKAKNG